MPDQATTPDTDFDPDAGMIMRIADHLVPLFIRPSVSVGLARQMAISAMCGYEPETRADFVNAARTIAFSMAALALLGQAAAQDVTMAEKLRAFGRANALNRSADQSERTMMQRRRYHQATPPAEQAARFGSGPELTDTDTQLQEQAMEAAVAEAMGAYRAQHPPTETAAARPKTRSVSPGPVADPATLAPQPGATVRSDPPSVLPAAAAIRHVAQAPSVPFKQALMHDSAIRLAVGPNSTLR